MAEAHDAIAMYEEYKRVVSFFIRLNSKDSFILPFRN